MDLLLIIALYSVIILIFVPLEKIGRVQTTVRNKWNKLIDRTK